MVATPNSRLQELLDQLRQEFENQSRSTGEFEHQCMWNLLSRWLVDGFAVIYWTQSVFDFSRCATGRPSHFELLPSIYYP